MSSPLWGGMSFRVLMQHSEGRCFSIEGGREGEEWESERGAWPVGSYWSWDMCWEFLLTTIEQRKNNSHCPCVEWHIIFSPWYANRWGVTSSVKRSVNLFLLPDFSAGGSSNNLVIFTCQKLALPGHDTRAFNKAGSGVFLLSRYDHVTREQISNPADNCKSARANWRVTTQSSVSITGAPSPLVSLFSCCKLINVCRLHQLFVRKLINFNRLHWRTSLSVQGKLPATQ